MELVTGQRGSMAWDCLGAMQDSWNEGGATYRLSPQREGGPGSLGTAPWTQGVGAVPTLGLTASPASQNT